MDFAGVRSLRSHFKTWYRALCNLTTDWFSESIHGWGGGQKVYVTVILPEGINLAVAFHMLAKILGEMLLNASLERV